MDADKPRIVIKFDDVSVAEAGFLAADLGDSLVSAHADIATQRLRDDPASMDSGATLAVLFGKEAIRALAKGIEHWLLRHQSAKLSIETPSGKLVVENITAQNAAELAMVLQRHLERGN